MALSFCFKASLNQQLQGDFPITSFSSPLLSLSLICLCFSLQWRWILATTNVCKKSKTSQKPSQFLQFFSSPHESLQKGNWVKLICGASFEVRERSKIPRAKTPTLLIPFSPKLTSLFLSQRCDRYQKSLSSLHSCRIWTTCKPVIWYGFL